MSSLAEIQFNYEKAIKQANQLDGIASRLTKAADNTLEGIMNAVHSAWKSDSAGGYLQKGRKVGQDMKTTARNLQNIAAAIRTIAARVREAELAAWRIANGRVL
ncbi:MAG: WXG100 family type VII secretion target [Oscillospiraceae bacterium]|nr:WXG100 family type VII secretion target [Oscillospiraceae bacterium]